MSTDDPTALDCATDTGPDDAYPADAGQFAARWNRLPADEREKWVQRILADLGAAHRCWLMGHEGRLERANDDLRAASLQYHDAEHARVEAVRDLTRVTGQLERLRADVRRIVDSLHPAARLRAELAALLADDPTHRPGIIVGGLPAERRAGGIVAHETGDASELVQRHRLAKGITPHPYGDSHTGMVCGATVMRDDGGDQCGLPADHPVHRGVPAEQRLHLAGEVDHEHVWVDATTSADERRGITRERCSIVGCPTTLTTPDRPTTPAEQRGRDAVLTAIRPGHHPHTHQWVTDTAISDRYPMLVCTVPGCRVTRYEYPDGATLTVTTTPPEQDRHPEDGTA